LKQLMTGAGFTGVRTATVVNRYPLRYWAKLFPLPAAAKGRVLAALSSGFPGSVQIPLPAGNLAVVGFRPD
ncbi:MAG TPA: hypothetical protein VHJ78_00370, partial [Actinomycetota bacterium]|nr:hypothetical protein [Actinomycetota bacterium]